MFGFRIVRKSYLKKLESLKYDLAEAFNRIDSLKEENVIANDKAYELEGEIETLNATIESLNKDMKSKDSHILKMGNELSKSRDAYNESVKEKELLKRTYMDMEKTYKMLSAFTDTLKDKYKRLEQANHNLRNELESFKDDDDSHDMASPQEEAKDADVTDAGTLATEAPADGIDESHVEEEVEKGTGEDKAIEVKTEEKKTSKKRKKYKKHE